MTSNLRTLIAAAVLASVGSAQATSVAGNTSGLIDLGSFSAGTYLLTGSGLIDLCGNGTFTMKPDGTPNTSVTCGNYGSYFNPNGSFSADGNFGRAGGNAKIGALIGTLNAGAFLGNNPSAAQAADWFLVGYSTSVTLSSSGHIFAGINDTYHPNNTGAFDISVQQIPEPGTYALMAAGLALLGASARRREAS